MDSYPKVYISILNWNNLSDTLDCINSVLNLDYPNFKVILVDNASDSNLKSILSSNYPNIILIQNSHNLGYTVGNNQAIQYAFEAGADYIWMVNNDVLVTKESLRILIATAERKSDIGLISPIIYSTEEPSELVYCGNYINLSTQKKFFTNRIEEIVNWQNQEPDRILLWGTALLIKSELVLEIGYLDNKFFAYYEDMDFSVRSILANYRNFIEINAAIYHKSISIGNRLPHYHFYMARNEYFFWQKYINQNQKPTFIVNYTLKIFRNVALYLSNGKLDVSKAYLDGLLNAFVGVGGDWVNRKQMPDLLTKLIFWLLMQLIIMRKRYNKSLLQNSTHMKPNINDKT